MSDFDPRSTLRPQTFTITVIPGTAQIEAAAANYEVVLPSGRAVQLQRLLDISTIQDVINQVAAGIVQELLEVEGLTSLWEPGTSIAVAASERLTTTDQATPGIEVAELSAIDDEGAVQ